MTEAAESLKQDPREIGQQLRPGLWQTINQRYPSSMITKADYVPLARLMKPLNEARLTLISSCGVHMMIIHQLKYPHDDADLDINVIFPIERLQELAAEGMIGGLTRNFFSFIGYNMDPERFEQIVAADIACAVCEDEQADVALLVPA